MMQTRCPRCHTHFRVTPEQLKARQGRVRCGQCHAVFNALLALEEELPHAPPPLRTAHETPPPEPAAEAAIEVAIGAAPEPLVEIAEAPAEILPEKSQAEPDVPALAPAEPEPVADVLAGADAAPEAAAAVEENEPPAGELGLEPLLHEAEKPRRAWPWALGAVAALLLLALQAIVQLRVELSVLYPAARPTLEALCGVFGYDIPLPRKIDLIGIETSDLHPDPTGEGRLLLVAGLRNRAPFAQPWPDLELTLTDTTDHALVRRVFAPADYLSADAAKLPFAARGEQAVSLRLEATGVPAVGYRLYVFYP